MERQIEMFMRGGRFRNMIESRVADICKRYGIKHVDTEILLYVSNCPQADTASDIQKFLSINKGYLSQRLDSLCKKGYMRAVPDREDRRYVHYPLEEKSEQLVGEINRIREETNAMLFHGVTEEERAVLKRVCAKIDENLQNMR